jgi:hypothetical protein
MLVRFSCFIYPCCSDVNKAVVESLVYLTMHGLMPSIQLHPLLEILLRS